MTRYTKMLMNFSRIAIMGLITLGAYVIGPVAACVAQDRADPFGGAAAPRGAPGPGSPPAAGGTSAEKSDDAAGASSADTGAPPGDVPITNDPIAVAVRESNPTTPRELARAAQILLDANQRKECHTYVRKLVSLGADDQTLLDLQREFGEALFLRIGRAAELAPEGKTLADGLFAAARRVVEDPARIDALIVDLANPETRARALVGLREAHSAATGPLIGVLADESRAESHRGVQIALRSLRDESLEPLIAALESEDAPFLARVAEVLGAMGDPRAIAAIAPLAYRRDIDEASRDRVVAILARSQSTRPSRGTIEEFLASQFLAQFRQDPSGIRVEGEPSPRSVWDAAGKTVVERSLTDAAAERWSCVRAAHDLIRVNADHGGAKTWHMAAQLEWEQSQAGIENRLPTELGIVVALTSEGPVVVEEVLEFSLEMGRAAAAVAAARVLAEMGGDPQLHTTDGRESPLVRALHDPNQHVQFAAVEAIMRINSARPFAGSARFRETLGFFLGSADARRVLIGNPRLDEARNWAGWLMDMGYEVDLAVTGNDILGHLQRRPDYEFVLMVDAFGEMDVRELVQLVRAVPGFAQMRCVILAHAWNYQRLESLPDADRGLAVLPLPQTVESMRFVMKATDQLAGQRPASPESRASRAATVLDWLAVATHSPSAAYHDLLRLEDRVLPLLADPSVGVRAARVLGGLATPKSQKRLADVASLASFPIEIRNAAAEAFAAAVQKRGVMLTSGEILQQYDRYNASENLGPESQRVMGAILDAIEKPSRAGQP